MTPPLNPIVVIPARLASTRLPDKPLADIGGAPMVVHVWRRAVAAGIGPVIVACAEQVIADAIIAEGGIACLTDAALASGSDRVHAAVEQFDPGGDHDVVVNLQGDLPLIDPLAIGAVLEPLADPAVDISTLAAVISDRREGDDPNVVKLVAGFQPGATVARALYFSRALVPSGDGDLYRHIGLYGFRRASLRRFIALEPGILERREGLEQLRALEAGMRIDVALVDTIPDGVDTPADLERVRAAYAGRDPPNPG